MKIYANKIDMDGTTIVKGDTLYTCNDFVALKDRNDTSRDVSFRVDEILIETTNNTVLRTSLIEKGYPIHKMYPTSCIFKVADNMQSAKKLYFDMVEGVISHETYETLCNELNALDNEYIVFKYENYLKDAIEKSLEA